MFEDFENMVKGKNPFGKKTPTVSFSAIKDVTRTPQTFHIKGKTIK